MRKPQRLRRALIVKHEDQHHTRLSIDPANFALTQPSQVSRWACARGQKDGSLMIYKALAGESLGVREGTEGRFTDDI